MLVFILGLGATFVVLYLVSAFSEPSHAHSDIPTEPKISQLQVLDIMEHHAKSKLPEIEEPKLLFQFYNYSMQQDSSNEYWNYIRKMGYGWSFDHIRQYPEPLQIPLYFVHANGTVYALNQTDCSIQKICDEPSIGCPIGRVGDAARDRLVYTSEIRWQEPIERLPYSEAVYIIDAESGKIVWSGIDYWLNLKPSPNANFDNKTIAQVTKEHLSYTETTHIMIENGASVEDNQLDYAPKEVRVTVGIDNRIVWTNKDTASHTVVSDDRYSNPYTGKFRSGQIEPGGSYEYIFSVAGGYPYHCEIHPWMNGFIDVAENFA